MPRMKKFTISVLVVPSRFDIALDPSIPKGAIPVKDAPGCYRELRTVRGYTLKDAKERAGLA